ncbi:MAG: SpoIIE family protein phosphatase, partial [Clostridia bacterium]|nr:SpoIIE family protein phosphatase [Clostridia bacterium]
GHLATGVNDASFFVQADVIIGSILFLFIPERLVTKGGRFCAGAVKDSTGYLGKEMEFAAKSLSDVRQNVMDIMAVFAGRQKTDDNVQKVSSRICGKCRNRLDCWEKNFENTNSAFMKVQSSKTGIFPAGFECVSKNRILEEFEKCRRDDAFSKMLLTRLNENRAFMFSQMEASEDIVNSLSARINVSVSKSMTSILCRTLDKYSIEFTSAIVFYTNENRLVAEIYICENAEIDIEQICDILSRELSVPLECTQPFACSGETRIRFSQKTRYSLDYAQFQLSAEDGEQSGDTCGYFTDGLGYAYVFVSDGMGHGSRAAVDSQLTAKLFKRLVRLGMSCEGAVKMINSVMLAKSEEESFATLDIAKINLETGGVTLCKSGASSTLIKYGDSVMMFSFASNPVGIIHDAHTCTKECGFSEGNVLVMMSDGVPENAYMYIKEQLILGTAPDELAENICRYSRKITSGNLKDDITAVCLKLI